MAEVSTAISSRADASRKTRLPAALVEALDRVGTDPSDIMRSTAPVAPSAAGGLRGDLYVHPSGPSMVAAAKLPPDPDFDPNGVMNKPGFKVMHVQDVDYRSTRQPFIACLEQVRQWSRSHTGHVPIFILVETKQGKRRGELHLTEPEPFTSSTFDALDAEIRSVFPPNEMITPDDVRGHYDTLNEAVLAGNWPSLASARGKVVFLMDQHSVGPVCLAGHPSLRGRVLFTNSAPGEPDAAFI